MSTTALPASTPHDPRPWEFRAESIVVRIRWFGILMGIVLVATRSDLRSPEAIVACLMLGTIYTTLDTAFHLRGEVFLKRWPLFVSMMEALFIGLLSYYDTGLDSPFLYYYFLSLICCAMRFRPAVAWTTFGLDVLSFVTLAAVLGAQADQIPSLLLEIVILAWVTWASSSLSGLLKAVGHDLRRANQDLQRNRDELECRVAERTAELRDSQARLLHQEKMANFGLLAAGIAHEVGNPLAALSNLVQMLQRRHDDDYTTEKLELAARQLFRIRRTIRELIDFSRPGGDSIRPLRIVDVVEEALNIAKYYQRTKDRRITTEIAEDLPRIRAIPDHLMQIVLNLILNAVDATERRGSIRIHARTQTDWIVLEIEDDGRGIPDHLKERVFTPYFTTKPRGTGLGLYVCQNVARDYGGYLSFADRDGGGTVFSLWIPTDAHVSPASSTRSDPLDIDRRSAAGVSTDRPSMALPMHGGTP